MGMNIHHLPSFSSDTSCFLESARFSSLDGMEFNPFLLCSWTYSMQCLPRMGNGKNFIFRRVICIFVGESFHWGMTRIPKISFKFCLNSCISLSCFPPRLQPGMETPLDVLSRAASLVHADDEKRKWGISARCFLLCPLASCRRLTCFSTWLRGYMLC